MSCAKPINAACNGEVDHAAHRFPLHRNLGLVFASATTLHAPVGTPTLERTVGGAERAGASEATRAMHKGDKFPNGSLEDDRCHGSGNSPKMDRSSKGFGEG
jgi:hypothetical protein